MNISLSYTPWFIWLLALGLGVAAALWPLSWLAATAGVLFLGGLILLIARQPLVGLAAALLVGPFGAVENIWWQGQNGPLDSGQLLFLITCAVWLAHGLAQRRVIIPHFTFSLPFLLFIGVMALTLLDAPSFQLGFTEIIKWVEMWLIMLMVVSLAHTRPFGFSARTFLLLALLMAGLLQAGLGLWQFGRTDGPEHFMILGRFYRAYGTFEQPNPFGGYVGLNGALALGVLVGYGMAWWQGQWTPGRPGRGWLLPAVALLGSVLLPLGVMASWSRGAWLGFSAAGGAIVLFWPRQWWRGVVFVGLAAGLALGLWQMGLLPASITDRLTTSLAQFRPGDVRGVDINDANYAVIERLAFWQAAGQMAQDEPWLGVGFGNYAIAYPRYALINWPHPLGHAHNTYLNLLAETGLIGLGSYLLLWMLILWHNLRHLHHLAWPQRGLAIGLMAGWWLLMVHQFVDKLYVNNIYLHLGGMVSLQLLLESNEEKSFAKE